jgi:hypothetical protein
MMSAIEFQPPGKLRYGNTSSIHAGDYGDADELTARDAVG